MIFFAKILYRTVHDHVIELVPQPTKFLEIRSITYNKTVESGPGLRFGVLLGTTRVAMTTLKATSWDLLTLSGVIPTGNEIGRGAYGRVFEVNYEGLLCAAKEVHALLLQYAQGDDLQKINDNFLSECQIWSTLRHPCIVQFLGSVIIVS